MTKEIDVYLLWFVERDVWVYAVFLQFDDAWDRFRELVVEGMPAVMDFAANPVLVSQDAKEVILDDARRTAR
jgi:hypothetical protein